jgi:hypothetical protein
MILRKTTILGSETEQFGLEHHWKLWAKNDVLCFWGSLEFQTFG